MALTVNGSTRMDYSRCRISVLAPERILAISLMGARLTRSEVKENTMYKVAIGKYTLGPTDTRDEAARLAQQWLAAAAAAAQVTAQVAVSRGLYPPDPPGDVTIYESEEE